MSNSISATATLQYSQLPNSPDYLYTISVTNTGTLPIGTFWFAWDEGWSFLDTAPITVTLPAGWTGLDVSHDTNGGGYGIQWQAGDPSQDIAPGATLTGFSFVSADTPAQVTGYSPFYPDSYTENSYVFVGDPINTPGSMLTVACFATGTRIRTSSGPVEVERLAVGNAVVLADGGTSRVAWIGRRTVDCRNHPDPSKVWPVRVRAGAFDVAVPSRDLLLSPEHCVLIDGCLVPVGALVDGDAVVQEPVDAVAYWHVELERHAVLLAEGLPCESFLDTGNRDAFANAGPVAERLRNPPVACAPLVTAGPLVEAARRRLQRARPLMAA